MAHESHPLCERYEDQLSDYLDGSLGADERDALDAHLRDCAGCRQTLDELRWVIEMMERVPAEPVPAALPGRIHAALAALPDAPEVEITPVERPAAPVVDIASGREKRGNGGGAPVPWWKRFNAPSAVAGAAVAAFLVAIWNMQPSNLPRIETAAVAAQEDVAVNIGFQVAESVENVTFQIDLPEGLKFVDENKQPMLAQSVSWKGSLKEGQTVIPIVVRGVRPGRYSIEAYVRKGPMMRKTTIVLPVEAS